jgi:hypothetical protein
MTSLLTHATAVSKAGLISICALLIPVTASASAGQEWNFRVYLDDKPIGYHHFRITQAGEHELLTTQAQFDVKFLTITVFKYRHENAELWDSQCLSSIASTTDENGKLFRVEGAATEKGFQLSTAAGEATLPPCISTFAYWDESFLRHDRLLNSQTGEYLEVDVDNLGETSIRLRDTSISANHYKLTGDELDIELWYSRSGEWLALQSTTEKGRLVRYVIE